MRLIDADAAVQMLMRIGDRKYRRSNETLSDAIKMLGSSVYTPTVDAVEVVRCRECKYHNKPRLGFCEMHLVRTNGNDFCSYGERKGGDE